MASTENSIFGKDNYDKTQARINNLIARHNADMSEMRSEMNKLKKSVSDGKNLVANAITSNFLGDISVNRSISEYGTTYPSFGDLASAIESITSESINWNPPYKTTKQLEGYYNGTISTNAAYDKGYIAGYSAGYDDGYAAGVADGGATVTPPSTSTPTTGPSGDATADCVLEGRTFQSAAAGSSATGTMPNRGKLNWAPDKSTKETLKAGYYSGGTLSTANAAPKTSTIVRGSRISVSGMLGQTEIPIIVSSEITKYFKKIKIKKSLYLQLNGKDLKFTGDWLTMDTPSGDLKFTVDESGWDPTTGARICDVNVVGIN